MRPGLLGVGVILAVLGVGAFAAGYMAPETRAFSGDGTSVPTTPIHANQTLSVTIDGPNGTDASLRLHWVSSVLLRVSLYPSPHCVPTPSACGSETALVAWPSADGANWSTSQGLSFPLLLVWSDAGSASGTFSANAFTSAQGPPSGTTISMVFTDAAAVSLALIGAVAIFLGVFLRGGVFRPPSFGRRRPPDSGGESAGAGDRPPSH